MIDTKRKEELSFSYLNALCSYEGIALEIQKHDDDGIDAIIKKDVETSSGKYKSSLAVQLKASSTQWVDKAEYIKYPLKVKNFNDLTTRSVIPQALFLFTLPKDEEAWIKHDIDQLIIRKCMYWCSFSGKGGSSNSSSVTIKIPKEQVVCPASLSDLLIKIAEEGKI